MLTLCTDFKIRRQKFPIWLLLSYLFLKLTHKYPTQFSETNNFKYKKYSLTSTKHSISVRRPKISNEFLSKEEKEIQSHSIFLRIIKTNLLESENERKYF